MRGQQNSLAEENFSIPRTSKAPQRAVRSASFCLWPQKKPRNHEFEPTTAAETRRVNEWSRGCLARARGSTWKIVYLRNKLCFGWSNKLCKNARAENENWIVWMFQQKKWLEAGGNGCLHQLFYLVRRGELKKDVSINLWRCALGKDDGSVPIRTRETNRLTQFFTSEPFVITHRLSLRKAKFQRSRREKFSETRFRNQMKTDIEKINNNHCENFLFKGFLLLLSFLISSSFLRDSLQAVEHKLFWNCGMRTKFSMAAKETKILSKLYGFSCSFCAKSIFLKPKAFYVLSSFSRETRRATREESEWHAALRSPTLENQMHILNARLNEGESACRSGGYDGWRRTEENK